MSWDEQVAAAEDALEERIREAYELEDQLEGALLSPGDRWGWFQRRRLQERWAMQPWSRRVKPNPVWALCSVGMVTSASFCMGSPAVALHPWTVVPILLFSGASSLGLAWVLTWLAGRQVIVGGRVAAALVQVRPVDQGARVHQVVRPEYGSSLPRKAASLLSDRAMDALDGGPAGPEELRELELVARLMQTRTAQHLRLDQKLRGARREQAVVWWHELSHSLDQAIALLQGPERDRGLAALRYLLLDVSPQFEDALTTRRVPELPPPSDWDSVGEAKAPEELLALGRE